MQVILTEIEYNELKGKAEHNKTTVLNTFYEDRCHYLQTELATITRKHKELQDKYNNLLVFGVSSSNEKLKYSKGNLRG